MRIGMHVHDVEGVRRARREDLPNPRERNVRRARERDTDARIDGLDRRAGRFQRLGVVPGVCPLEEASDVRLVPDLDDGEPPPVMTDELLYVVAIAFHVRRLFRGAVRAVENRKRLKPRPLDRREQAIVEREVHRPIPALELARLDVVAHPPHARRLHRRELRREHLFVVEPPRNVRDAPVGRRDCRRHRLPRDRHGAEQPRRQVILRVKRPFPRRIGRRRREIAPDAIQFGNQRVRKRVADLDLQHVFARHQRNVPAERPEELRRERLAVQLRSRAQGDTPQIEFSRTRLRDEGNPIRRPSAEIRPQIRPPVAQRTGARRFGRRLDAVEIGSARLDPPRRTHRPAIGQHGIRAARHRTRRTHLDFARP